MMMMMMILIINNAKKKTKNDEIGTNYRVGIILFYLEKRNYSAIWELESDPKHLHREL